MALTIETGTGVAGANSFVTEAEADAHFASRYAPLGKFPEWGAAETEKKEAALVLAGQLLNGKRWQGEEVREGIQTMCWPRYGVPMQSGSGMTTYGNLYNAGSVYAYTACWPSNTVPEKVKQAQCEAALRYLAGTDMLPDLDRGGQIVMKRVDIITTQYASGAPAGTRFQAVEALLRPFLKSSAGVTLVRG